MSTKQFPRGVSPEVLISQVRNTMPYIFERPSEHLSWDEFLPSAILRSADLNGNEKVLSHTEYFKLCVSSHYLTCATPVPTDVDNQIRYKLWPEALPLSVALEMVDFVLQCRTWDFKKVSSRYVALGEAALDGHLGEWFTISCGAYCALKRYADPAAKLKREELFDQIADEVRRHAEIFGAFWRGGDGLACLKASSCIAHNFGDLDRVMDMWELAVDDPLRLQFYKLCSKPFDQYQKLRYLGGPWVAGELYKSSIGGSSMAFENHRHFALRKPRCLRQSPKLLIPIGPFLDQWGREVGTFFRDNLEDLHLVGEALQYGWERLPQTVGYGRALSGILECVPEYGKSVRKLPHMDFRMSQAKFEALWANEALRWMDEIPSRARP